MFTFFKQPLIILIYIIYYDVKVVKLERLRLRVRNLLDLSIYSFPLKGNLWQPQNKKFSRVDRVGEYKSGDRRIESPRAFL